MSGQRLPDPVEQVIAEALDAAGVSWVGDSDQRSKNLDFYLPQQRVHIECKRFHTDRTAEQIARSDEVILIVGMGAARTFANLIAPHDFGAVAMTENAFGQGEG